jgi:hypothetical protein
MATTVAAGSGAPASSVTRPRMLPVVVDACAAADETIPVSSSALSAATRESRVTVPDM